MGVSKSHPGEVEIDRLIETYPSQRSAGLRAKVRVIARQASEERDLSKLSRYMNRLPDGERGFLAEIPRLRQWVSDIATQQERLSAMDRPALREPLALALRTEIENFGHRIKGFHEPIRSEFGAAAAKWLEIADRQLDEIRSSASRSGSNLQVFRAGDPVDRANEAFVPREVVVGELERQVLLATGCPGILLYGRRRMGKSTTLKNLVGFLPVSVHFAGITMEDPETFTSTESLIARIAQEIRQALPDERLSGDPRNLVEFIGFLDRCNDALERKGRRLLFAIDEYGYLDRKIGEGTVAPELLPTLRTSIQRHRALIWAFAGSEPIEALNSADWNSYFVSLRTVEVPPFSEKETRLLLTEPMRHSKRWDDNDAARPRFHPEFWGDRGIERVHAEAGGWPHLVQLIAETVVDLTNDADSSRVTPAIFEQALDKAIVAGDTVLRQLLERECRLPGEWDYLSRFRTLNMQPPPADELIYKSLRRRLIVEEVDGEWRLRVPLMQHWLRKRG